MEQQVEEGYSGGRLEPIEPGSIGAVDVTSAYGVTISGEESEHSSNATEPVVLEELVAVEVAEEASLPPVPEGVVPSEPVLPVFDSELPPGTMSLNFAETRDEEGKVETLRFLGSSIGPELDFISPEEGTATFGEVMIQLIDQALESQALDSDSAGVQELTGEKVAQIFCRGDTDDPRVSFLLLLLAQNEPITADLVLRAAEAHGHADLVDGARLAREELTRAGDVSVEQLSAEGWRAEEVRPEARGPSRDPDSGSEPQASCLKPRAASEARPS